MPITLFKSLDGWKQTCKSKIKINSFQAFKMCVVEKQNIPSFDELGIKNLWNHFKDNATIMMYMPEYLREQIPEKDFFYNVLSTIYSKEVGMLIDAAYKARQSHYRKQ